VTEAEWLACDEPWPMLEGLPGTASDRKLRLFAVACCRQALGDVPDAEPLREAVEVAERFADDRAGRGELEAARQRVASAILAGGYRGKGYYAATSVAAAARGEWPAPEMANQAAYAAYEPGESPAAGGERLSGDVEGGPKSARPAVRRAKATEAGLLRDIVGNPFRAAPRIDPAWIAWNGGTVPKLAEAVYDGRAFDRLPVLADALEDAGCSDPGLLGHLRGPGRTSGGVGRWTCCWARNRRP
jgi:hypothetical protein